MIGIKDQAFGLELEFTGITRRRAAQEIGRVINGNPHYDYLDTIARGYEDFSLPVDILNEAMLHALDNEYKQYATN